MWVRFLKPYDFTPAEDRRGTVAYAAGFVGNVRRACGEAAIAAGCAEPHTPEGKDAGEPEAE